MSVLIKFSNGSDWFRANWIFRQLQADIAELFPNDEELNHSLEVGAAMGGIDFDDLDETLVGRTLTAMKTVAVSTIEGNLEGVVKVRPNDREGERMYLESMQELLDRLNVLSR